MLLKYGVCVILVTLSAISWPLEGISQTLPKLEKIQLVDLKGIRPGDMFIFRLMWPKPGFFGYTGSAAQPNIRPPRGLEDFDASLQRVNMLNVENAPSLFVHMRVDEVNVGGGRWDEGKYEFALQVRGDNAEVIYDDGTISPMSFPFSAYPNLSVLQSSNEIKQRAKRHGEVVEWTYRPEKDGKTVTVEVRYSDIMKREPEQLKLRYVDTTLWEIGSPFFAELKRQDPEGNIILRCELVGRQFRKTPQSTGK